MAPGPQVQVHNALIELADASSVKSSEKKPRVFVLVKDICDSAIETGISPEHLSTIISLVTRQTELDQPNTSFLIRNLFPAQRISSDVVLRIIGCLGLGPNKPSSLTQAALLKWLILVYDFIEDRHLLSSLYGVLFNLLDMMSLRSVSFGNLQKFYADGASAPLCHLLALITKRKDVRPYRIQMLLELSQNTGHDPAIVGLIRIYKTYYPDIVVSNTSGGKASFFKHPDPEWKEKLYTIQEANSHESDETSMGKSSFKVSRINRDGSKRRKVSIVPEVYTSRAQESSVTIEEIDSVDDFVGKMEKIELPSQAVAALDEPLLQKFLSINPSETATKRIERWLIDFFDDEIRNVQEGVGESKHLSEVLEKLLDFVRYTKILPGPADSFLRRYLPFWDGILCKEYILQLLVYINFTDFADFQDHMLNYVEEAVIESHSEPKLTLLEFYATLLRSWTYFMTAKGLNQQQRERFSAAFTALSARAETLCLSVLEDGTPTVKAMSAVLFYYEAVSSAISDPVVLHQVRITTPAAKIVYILAFSPSLMVLSRLCSILASYKRALEAAMATGSGKGGQKAYDRSYVNFFNGYLMDVCNCLWRNRAFNIEDTNALGCLAPSTILPSLREYVDRMGYSLPALFSLSYNPVLCGAAIDCMRSLEDTAHAAQSNQIRTRHAGPVTQRSLTVLETEGGLKLTWAAYRLEMLKWMEQRGISGISELMFNTMKHLMQTRAG